jgi:nitrogen fixation/metabolism regulation signal transduction histidine kinase
MLSEMQQSRARIVYLQRIGAWQEMAQRLAHEIKNPLTPIQLAVQECHRKYDGADSKFRSLLDTTLEIVEEEVGTLRRLVGNFSSFARLPQAELREADLRDFVRECSEQLGHLEHADDAGNIGAESSGELDALTPHNVKVEWEVPRAPLPAAIDRQMLRRVLVNLVRNAAQAVRDARAAGAAPDAMLGHVVVSARPDDDGAIIAVEDDGPGVPDDMRDRIFDPYFTTKVDGTGLGLAIVKKIVVEHGGSIEVGTSARLGGAKLEVRLPGPHSLAILAARERAALPPARPSSRALA